MKKHVLALASALIFCSSQAQSPSPYIPRHPWFEAEKIKDSVWKISDNGEDNFYLVMGTDSALLIDNGIGAVDLLYYIRKITALPLIVVNTHGHPDHVGSNNQFQKVYAHPLDIPLIKNFTNKTNHKQVWSFLVRDSIPANLKFDYNKIGYAELATIQDKYVFDLGNRSLEVIHVPGHTKGSICLIDKKDSLLFSGDHIKSVVWLHLPESATPRIYLASLDKLINRGGFNRILPGHDLPFDASYIHELRTCIRNIISGRCKPINQNTVVGKGLLCAYKSASIIYRSPRTGKQPPGAVNKSFSLIRQTGIYLNCLTTCRIL